MKKRLALIVAAALAATTVMAGCSSGNGQKATGAPAAESVAEGTAAGDTAAGGTEAERADAGKGQEVQESETADPMAAITDDGTKKTITYWHTFTEGARKDYIDEMVAEYMKEHPNVTINVEVYPWNVFT